MQAAHLTAADERLFAGELRPGDAARLRLSQNDVLSMLGLHSKECHLVDEHGAPADGDSAALYYVMEAGEDFEIVLGEEGRTLLLRAASARRRKAAAAPLIPCGVTHGAAA